MNSKLAELGLLIVGIFWGLGFIFIKIGLNEGIDPIYLSTMRFLLGSLVIYIIFMKKIGKIKKEEILVGSIVGVFLFLGFGFQTTGANYTTASKNAFFTAINVVMVPYFYWVINKKRPELKTFISSLLCLIGIGIISFDKNMDFSSLNKGDIMTLLGAFFFAGQISLIGYFSKKYDVIKLILLQMLTGGILFLILLLTYKGVETIRILNGIEILSILYIVIFSTVIAFLLQTYCQKWTTATKASILLATESLFAPLFAFLILNEEFSLRIIIGALVIIMAVILSEIDIKKIKNTRN